MRPIATAVGRPRESHEDQDEAIAETITVKCENRSAVVDDFGIDLWLEKGKLSGEPSVRKLGRRENLRYVALHCCNVDAV